MPEEYSNSDETDQAAKDAAVEAAFDAWHTRPKGLDAEAVTALWEAMWQAADFSWEGLADAGWDREDQPNAAQKLKRWRAPADFPGDGAVHGEDESAWKEATLQDYWRWSLGFGGDAKGERRLKDPELEAAGLLVRASDGMLRHRLHLRPDAAPSSSADLRSASAEGYAEHDLAEGGDLTPLLLARLAVGFETEEYGPEGSLRLIGARAAGLGDVLRDYAATDAQEQNSPPLFVNARLAELHHFDVGGAQFHGEALFGSAQFHGAVGFVKAQFHGEALFGSAQFHGAVGFVKAQFHGEALFGSAQFHGAAEFGSAQFHGTAEFFRAQFHGTAAFRSAHFHGTAGFLRAHFHDAVWFESAHFHDTAGFGSAHFHDTAWFGGAPFHDAALFGKAHFHDTALFDSAQFHGRAGFRSAHFQGEALFGSAHFGGTAEFESAHFYGAAGFGSAHFHGAAGFESAQFHSTARFVDAAFSAKAGAGPVRFRSVQFFKLADFSGCVFPNQPERIQGAFKTARFLEEAQFRSPDFDTFSAFDGAVFKGKLLLAAAAGTEREEQRRFDAVLRATEAAVEKDRRVKSAADYNRKEDEDANERDANNRFAALEGGLRTLKTAMEAEKNHMQEHRFFRFELQAKQRRPSVSWMEKVASRSYGLLSDYGNSMGRPLAALGLSVLLLWVVYWVWGLSLDPSFFGVEKERTALEFSIRNVVQPFSPWTATTRSTLFELDIVKIVSCGKPAEEACPSGGGIGWLAFRLLATLQSVFSLLLAFLFALALRKKFQIS